MATPTPPAVREVTFEVLDRPATLGVETFGSTADAVDDPAAGGPGFESRYAALLDRVARAVHAAARGEEIARDDVGLYVATGMVDSAPEDLLPALAASRGDGGEFDPAAFLRGGFRSIHPLWPLAMLNNVAVGRVAEALAIRGDHTVLGCEDDSGALAVGLAADAVRDGAVRAVVLAGVSERPDAAAFARARLRHGAPAGAGEGAAALWLEAEESACARGLVPLGFVAGWAAAFGPSPDGPGPSADAIARAAREALADAGREPGDVTLVVSDGASVEEAAARREVFGSRRGRVATLPVGMAEVPFLAATPALGVGLALHALAAREAPSPTGGTPRSLRAGGVALVLATGHGGAAAALVVEGPA